MSETNQQPSEKKLSIHDPENNAKAEEIIQNYLKNMNLSGIDNRSSINNTSTNTNTTNNATLNNSVIEKNDIHSNNEIPESNKIEVEMKYANNSVMNKNENESFKEPNDADTKNSNSFKSKVNEFYSYQKNKLRRKISFIKDISRDSRFLPILTCIVIVILSEIIIFLFNYLLFDGIKTIAFIVSLYNIYFN